MPTRISENGPMARFRGGRRIRDRLLLDALESLVRAPYEGKVSQSVREGRDPLACWRVPAWILPPTDA